MRLLSCCAARFLNRARLNSDENAMAFEVVSAQESRQFVDFVTVVYECLTGVHQFDLALLPTSINFFESHRSFCFCVHTAAGVEWVI